MRHVCLVGVGIPGEIAAIAPLGALPVGLPITEWPEVARVPGLHLEKLTAWTHEPEIMQGEHHRDVLPGCLQHERRGEVAEMAHMDQRRLDLCQQGPKVLIHVRVPIAIPRPRDIDDVQLHTRVGWIVLLLQVVFGEEAMVLAGEDMHVVSARQRLGQRLGIHLGASVIAHGIAMDHLDNLHVFSPG